MTIGVKAIYISMLSEERNIIQGYIKECVEKYNINVLLTRPGKSFSNSLINRIVK